MFNLLVILGPTASGKTRLGVEMARRLGGEIISADSRQVYRELNLGVGKDLAEYARGGAPVPHHLIDIADLSQEFNVFEFQKRFGPVWADIRRRGRLPILVGGTGLYLASILERYALNEVPRNHGLRVELAEKTDAELAARLRRSKGSLHNTTDLTDRDRLVRAIEIAEAKISPIDQALPELSPLVLGVRWDRTELRERIRIRLRERMEAGLLAEVRGLLNSGVPAERLRRLGLEYRLGVDHLEGRIAPLAAFEEQLFLAIADFAKRQETWFRRMERRGTRVHWIDQGSAAAAWERVSAIGTIGTPSMEQGRSEPSEK